MTYAAPRALTEAQRVVVTGIGLVTPFGIGIAPFWDGLRAGQSAVGPITRCDPGGHPTRIAAEVPGFEPREFMDHKEARRVARSVQFAVACARLALTDAKLDAAMLANGETGVVIGAGSTAPPETEQMFRGALPDMARVSPFYLTGALPNMAASQVAIQLGLHGYTTTIATACAAGAQALGEAAEVIRRGEAQIMLAGGTEAPICQASLATFGAMRALSTRNDDPTAASRPFDAHRDGFVLAEGAGVLVLERLDHAQARGAMIYAELLGYASTCDAHHVTAPRPDGDGPARAMRRAIARAGLTPEHVGYINAHATSTPVGDAAETNAIKRAFGDYARRVPVSATKSMIGHLTSAAGAVEAAATILALKHQMLPPTINYHVPDPDCDLDYVPNVARPATFDVAISNSFGFGGVNAVLVLAKLPATTAAPGA